MSDASAKRPDPPFLPDLAASAPAMSDVGGLLPDTPSVENHASSSRALPFDIADGERYERGHVIGVGGMGRVVQAFDRRLSREVALKEVSIGRDWRGELEERLAREAAVTARLEHPGIVPVHDTGRLPDGTPFYTMRIVRGRSLATAIPEATDTPARRQLLRHVLDACQAVGWAHRHGVVHRDLKPANIMVGEFGETQVVDWGLASESASVWRQSDAAPEASSLTRFGTVLGTPRYMSPEQARGDQATARSDVWSLGCVLHEVITGTAAVSDGSSAEVIERVKRGVTVMEPFSNDVPVELRAILRRALEPDALRRYEDAKALAEDLARYLDGDRVVAHDYTAWELVVRLARAWKTQLIVAGVALVALIVFILIAFDQIDAERELAEKAQVEAESAADLAIRSEDRAVQALERSDASLASALAGESIQRSRRDARPEAEILAAHALSLRDLPEAMGVLMGWDAMAPPELIARVPRPEGCLEADITRDGAWLACRARGTLTLYRVDPPLSSASTFTRRWSVPHDGLGVAILEGSNLIGTVDPHELLAFFDVTSGARAPRPAMNQGGLSPRASADGRTLWIVGGGRLMAVRDGVSYLLERCDHAEEVAGTIDASGLRWAISCRDGTVFVGDLGAEPRAVATGFGMSARSASGPRQGEPLVNRAPAASLAFTRDGQALLMADTVGALALVDLASGAHRFVVDSGLGMPRQLAMSPDGRFAAVLGERVGVKILDLAVGQWRGALPLGDVRGLTFVEDAAADLVTFGEELRRWRLTDGTLARLDGPDGVTSISVTREKDGPLLAITRGKGLTVTTLDGQRRFDGGWYDGIVKGGAFTTAGDRYGATSGVSRRATHFATDTWEPLPGEVDFIVPGREVSVLSPPERPNVWVNLPHTCGVLLSFDDAPDTQPLFRDACPNINDLARSANGRFIAMLDSLEGVVWTLDAHDALTPIRNIVSREATTIAIDDDGTTLIAAEAEAIGEWELGDPSRLVHLYDARGATFLAVALSSHYVAGGARDGSTWIWDRRTGSLRARLRDHAHRVSALAFVDDSYLITGSWDWSIRLRSLAALEVPRAEWVRRVENRWGLTLSDVLGRPSD